VLPSPCYIVADAHVGAAPLERERELLSFLRSMRDVAASLVINGDLFDFWFEWRHVMPRRGYRLVAALADLRESGMPVLWIAGNHDCWGGEFLREEVGVDFHIGPWEGTLAGWHTRIEHGDGLRALEDRGYRAIKPVLRSPLSVRAFRLLHPDFASRLALGSSHTSRKMSLGDGGRGLRRVAMDRLASDPSLELVVFGHSHIRALERAEGGGVYANSGAWKDEGTFLRVDEREIALLQWNGSPEGDRLHVLERRAEEALRHS
jgi:UDP-2,3-diacylglucosamine hydrolase